ncbi:flavodoxin-dependent (E)-4-hydroxy-3-methylbut-2-enyl-diphosphate synthase [Clostridiaceae bacterium HSG29]|nr:flavodoxin-dependent (E)-4-hydroxy-3-methylbut-2-enyl-diphosphate synthase [Clostridiaceae bacterium HSG29]
MDILNRRKTRQVKVGNLIIGSENRVIIQSMTTTRPSDIEETVKQILALEKEGCELVRVTVPTMEDAQAISKIKEMIHIPLVADIHFDYRLAIESIKNGIDKLRLNPGNIGDRKRVEEVVKYAKEYGVPIRIGVNSGSLSKEILEKYKKPCPEAIVESAMEHILILEELDFKDIIISLKSSDVIETILSYQLLAQKVDYPFHIGITEAGTKFGGTIKSSVGIGSLLVLGFGDTLRVSLTGDPTEEIRVAKGILKSLKLRDKGVNVISCPTCGRCNINLVKIATEVEKKLSEIDKNITVAIMGCIVNGPGEAREADIGIAGGINEAILFKKGEIVRKINEDKIIDELLEEIERME